MSLDAGRTGVRSDQVDTFGRVISKSFLNELVNDLPEWTDMLVWNKGTEQLIPLNSATPLTSPILADIEYPDGLRSNQQFTFRESPTEVDGLAKIRTIKGNTIVWNQFIESKPTQTINGVTFTNNGDGSYTVNGTATAQTRFSFGYSRIPIGHKVLFKGCPSGGSISTYCMLDNMQLRNWYDIGNGAIYEVNNTNSQVNIFIQVSDGVTVNNLKFYPQLFDLTARGLDSLTLDEVKEWFAKYFPLPYYAYNQGSLLNFTGTAIKTTGKNLISDVMQGYSITSNGGYIYSDPGVRNYAVSIARVEMGKTYYLSDNGLNRIAFYYDKPVVGTHSYNETIREFRATFTAPITGYVAIVTSLTASSGLQLETGGSTEYEQYTEHTTNLPIATYFPTGMKSARTVYDELNPRKAITRVGSRVITSFTGEWGQRTNGYAVYVTIADGTRMNGGLACDKFTYSSASSDVMPTWSFGGNVGASTTVTFILPSTITTKAEADAWANANPITLYYELATPIELPTLEFGE